MAQPLPIHTSASTSPLARTSSATFFGIPVGDFGWFGSLLIGVAAGFIAFFATTFCSIIIILIADSAHANIDYAISYRYIGFPVGVVAMIAALSYLGTLWFRRVMRKA